MTESDAVAHSAVDAILDEVGRDKCRLVPILQAVQAKHHYLPEAVLRRICDVTEISPRDVAGVVSFYSQFRTTPAGRHTIRVCIGTACHVKGADSVHDAFKRHLLIPESEDTDAGRVFTVEKVACLGCCMLAPAVQIDDVTYGFVGPLKVPGIIADFLRSRRPERAGKPCTGRAGPAAGEVRVCLCSSCSAGGARPVHAEAAEVIARLGLPAVPRVVGCTGVSYQAPLLEIALEDERTFRYGKVRAEDVRGILLRHFRPAGAWSRTGARLYSAIERLYTDDAWEPVTRYSINTRSGPDVAYFGKQTQLVTEHCGELDPSSFRDYVNRGGFEAWRRCLQGLSPEQVIDELERSGLRGRGGAGFPSGRKWRSVRASRGPRKYVVCNGDEGDPGAFMDRMILESFPYRVIEGMSIAAYAVGAAEGWIYVRNEYPLALARLRQALARCEEENIHNGLMAFHVVEGAGAFVCGEETALIAALEGRRGAPRFRPPYPSEQGLFGKPTLISNVETLASVPWIISHGAGAFSRIGTRNSPGTKTFALAGKVVRGGLIEVPMGMTLAEIVEDIGGGAQDGKRIKAIQVGGPSGGCVPAALFDVPVDYDALVSHGAFMGSGGLVVLDDTDCMVEVARYFMSFTQRESCGKCTCCRIGTKRMFEVLERLCAGEGKPEDIAEIESLGNVTREGSLCGLGRSAPNPVMSTLRYFRGEYEEHVAGRCPAHRCKALIHYRVTDDCIGCTRCSQGCPTDAIPMNPYRKHVIDQEKCVRCGTCRQVCPSNAIDVQTGPAS